MKWYLAIAGAVMAAFLLSQLGIVIYNTIKRLSSPLGANDALAVAVFSIVIAIMLCVLLWAFVKAYEHRD